MKVQNNKTGEIGVINLKVYGDDAEYNYESLKEFNEDWGDVKFPLIKNEKLKEIFREWGKVIGIDGKTMFTVTHHNCSSTTLFQTDDDALFTIELPGYFGENNETYTLEQIIGEE